jgi:hypothetical protein
VSADTSVLWRLYGALVVVVVAIWTFTLAQSYEGRARLVESQRIGCERNKLDRLANADGWWSAEAARMDTATDPGQEPHARSSARLAAEQYAAIGAQLEARGHIDCRDAYPAASLWPF